MQAPNPAIDTDAIALPEAMRLGWQKTVDLIAELLHCPAAFVTRLRAERADILVHNGGIDQQHLSPNGLACTCEGVLGGQPIGPPDRVLDHTAEEAGRIPCYGLPLSWPDGRPFGALCVREVRSDHGGPCRRLLEQFRDGMELGLAALYDQHQFQLSHDRLETRGSEHRRLAGIVQSIGLILDEGSDLDPMLQALLQGLTQIDGIDSGGVYLLDAQADAFVLRAHMGLSSPFVAMVSRVQRGHPRYEVIQAGTTVYTTYPELLATAPGEARSIHTNEGLRALAVFPIRHEGKVIACLNLASHTQDAILPSSRRVLEDIARRIGGVIARKALEQRLAATRGDLQSLVDAMDDMLFVIEPGGEVLYTNPAVTRHLGYPPDEVRGRDIRTLHPPEYAQACDPILAAASREHTAFCAVPFQGREGEVFPVETRLSAGHWQGRPALFGIACDVRDRVQAEQALRHNEEVLEQVFATTGFLFAYLDPRFNFIRVNRAYAESTQREPGDLLGRNHFELYPDAENEAIFRRVVETGEPYHALARPFAHPDQPERGMSWWDWTLSPVRGRDGEVTGVLLSLQDVSDRVSAQAELTRLATVVEQAPVTIVITDLDARIVYANPYFERVTGYPVAEVIGQNPRILQSGQRGPAFYQGLWSTITAGRVWYGHLVNRRKDGGLYHEAATIFPIKDEAGKIVNYAAVKRNITRQIETEAELARHREHLEELVTERTAALEREITERRATEQALKKARTAAEAANHAKSAFLANMSHELRTPLNAVLGFSQLMARAPDMPPEHQRHLQIINRSGEHLLEMINDVLDLSKIESGKIELNPQTVHLVAMLRDLAEMFRLRTHAKGLGFELLIDPALPEYVVIDPGKLRQILINLLGNAVKFTERGGVTLSAIARSDSSAIARSDSNSVARPDSSNASARHAPEHGRILLCLEVSDTGIGIPQDKIEQVFEPFVQSGPLYRNQDGTGLGLAISQAFARLLGGSIRADSTPGHGSRFRLEAPALTATAPEDEDTGLDYGRVLGLEPGQPEWRLLVVDDEEANRALLTGLLTQAGFLVQSAASGEAALAIFRNWSPHLVWLDMRMPGMDGFDTAKAIRRLPGGRAAKLIIVTAGALETRLKAVLESGCDDLLGKPFQPADLFRLVAKHLPVRYRMDETLHPSPRLAALNLEDFEELPAERVHELRDAILSLDAEEIEGVAARIASLQPALGAAIAALAQTYHLDRLLDLCEQTLGEGEYR